MGLNSKDSIIELCGGVGTIFSQRRTDKSTNNALTIASDEILLGNANYVEIITDAVYGSYPSDSKRECYSNLVLNSFNNYAYARSSEFGLHSNVGEFSASISGIIMDDNNAAMLNMKVETDKKSTRVRIYHEMEDDGNRGGNYEGMEIRGSDVIKIRSNTANNMQRDFSIGVGIGAGGINRGIHDMVNNHWMLYCDEKDLYYQAPKTSKIKPYYRAGDSIQLYYQGAGFATSDGKYVVFTLPINKPIDANNVVASSVSGFIGRSNGKYTHGSASSTYVKPASYEAVINGNAVRVSMNFNNNTNVTNNAAIGVTWSGKITFS